MSQGKLWTAKELRKRAKGSRLVSLEDACAFLGVSARLVRALDIPFAVVPNTHGRGRRVYVRADLEAWVSAQVDGADPLTGWVYLISDGAAYKIGYTNQSPEERRAALQEAQWRKLATLASLETESPRLVESRLHQTFAHLRVDREWFRPAQEIEVAFATLSALDPRSIPLAVARLLVASPQAPLGALVPTCLLLDDEAPLRTREGTFE